MKLIRTLDDILAKISNACAWVSGIMLFLMSALIFINVILRYVFRDSITGADELVTLMMVFVVYFGLSYSTRLRAHVRVDSVTNLFPEYVRLAVYGIVTLLCIFVSVNISIRTFKYAPMTHKSEVLSIPLAPFYYMISVLNILLSFEFLADGIKWLAEAAEAYKNRHNKIEEKGGAEQ